MSQAAKTLKIFAVYLVVLGLTLLFVPNRVLPVFGLPFAADFWIHVVGVTAFNIGIYYWYAAVSEAVPFFKASVCTRTFVFVSFSILALGGRAPPMLVLFGVIDLGGAIWTLLALRSDKARKP